jgi:hypothetical protein
MCYWMWICPKIKDETWILGILTGLYEGMFMTDNSCERFCHFQLPHDIAGHKTKQIWNVVI